MLKKIVFSIILSAFFIISANAELYNPSDFVTVGEGVRLASRIHAALNGNEIPEDGLLYAKQNGFYDEDNFDGTDVYLKRFQIAELIAAVCPDLPLVNDTEILPDVALGTDYADDILYMYKAGVFGGKDEYGNFEPYSYLTYGEMASIAARVSDYDKRVKNALVSINARAFTDSYSIIEAVYSSGRNGLANGWNYDNRFDLYNTSGTDKTTIHDFSDEAFYAFIRDFDAEKEGILRLELSASITSTDGCVYLAFQNGEEETVFEVAAKNGKWVLVGETEVVSDVSVQFDLQTRCVFVVDIDLDENTAELSINNIYCGKVNIPESELSRLVLGTNKVGMGTVYFEAANLVKNRPIDEHFFVPEACAGQKPVSWNITGGFNLQRMNSMRGYDFFSAKTVNTAGTVSTASKKFTPVTGKVVFETFVLLPEKTDGAAVSLMSGEDAVFTFETKNGKFVMGDTVLHDYTANVWQDLYIEADVFTGKADIKINGKKRATVDFDAKHFDGVNIEFAPKTSAVMWFDDVSIYNLIDHADYPSEPVVAESKDYNVGMNVCFLWRDTQSGEGWDATSPFPEFDPYLGFYDEGLRETADWELKLMAEHGIDFMHVCWYCPTGNQTVPIKKMRVSHGALHDGYMNAKYSDLVDFCIMWENNGQDVTSFEQFKAYIWPYWKEYYFADDRYARLDNKAVLTVWNSNNMKTAFGGTAEGVKQAIAFMDAELREMGYDGIIVLFSTTAVQSKSTFETFENYGADATYGYHWGTSGYDADHQINCNNSNLANSEGSLYHIPTVSVGFNDVGRNETRDPIITGEDHLKVCEYLKDKVDSFNTGTWKDNTVMVSTLNEFSEGTYVMPTTSNGFDYLENIRKVFTDDTNDHTENDAPLTKTQIDRVGHLYPSNHSPIRRYQLEDSDESAEELGLLVPENLFSVRSFDMSKTDGTDSWQHHFGISNYSEKDGVIKGTSNGSDFAIITNNLEELYGVDIPVLHIRMKNTNPGAFEVFYTTSTDSSWGYDKRTSMNITKTGEFVDYYVNMSSTANWTNIITAIRIDPNTVKDTFEISLIELMDFKDEAVKVPTVTVNGTIMGFTFTPRILADGDFEVAGEARKLGFYSSLRVYHEWDRFTGDGVLTLKTREEDTLVFKVGSDKVTVNGKEQELGYTFRLRDGLPVFRMKKLCELLGYSYTVDCMDMSIIAGSESEYDLIKNKVDNQWEFNSPGESEGWTSQHSSIYTSNGYLVLNATSADPAIIHNVSFSASKYTHIVVGVEYTSYIDKAGPQLFFTTSASKSYTADKCISGRYDVTGKSYGDTVEVIFDLSANSMFTGRITGLRFDPFGMNAPINIDYFRCIFDTSTQIEDGLVEVDDENQWYFETDGNLEGWNPQNNTLYVKDGCLSAVTTGGDTAVKRAVDFDASEYQSVVIGLKFKEVYWDAVGEFFFTTEASSSWAADKGVRAKYSIPVDVKDGDLVKIRFDVSDNALWTGKVKYIRFDPFSNYEDFEIEYIRLYKTE